FKDNLGIICFCSKIVFKVRKDNFYPVKVELYNKGGKLFKIATTTNIKKIGKYWVAEEATMEDLKSKHKTKMILLKAKFDTGILNKKLSKRYLSR
ncbi:MAG: outer membrane lipoprotein-sorting protein, partial [Spirochaetota bacterium]|nr:outer membrane lipoprotein-sorting protein [Spirochaetota bacterium]